MSCMCSSPITQMRRSRIGAWESSLHREPHTLRRGDVGAEIIHELKPHDSDHHIVKKGFGGIANAALNITPRNMGVTTCAIVGLTTCVCVSNTVRGGVEHNYRMTWSAMGSQKFLATLMMGDRVQIPDSGADSPRFQRVGSGGEGLAHYPGKFPGTSIGKHPERCCAAYQRGGPGRLSGESRVISISGQANIRNDGSI